MVSDVIIVAIITGICSVFGQWLISREREIRLDERLKSVEKKLDEHNGYADRIAEAVDIAEELVDIIRGENRRIAQIQYEKQKAAEEAARRAAAEAAARENLRILLGDVPMEQGRAAAEAASAEVSMAAFSSVSPEMVRSSAFCSITAVSSPVMGDAKSAVSAMPVKSPLRKAAAR